MKILSIDGGASHTRGVIFSEKGEIVAYQETEATSLSRPDTDSTKIIGRFIQKLCSDAGLDLEQLDLASVGVAGVSSEERRAALFRELQQLGLGTRAVVTSDVEAAYEATWGNRPGVLLCVGTGAIGWARDAQGNTHRASGRGPQTGGDPSSGYWIGKTAMVHLIMNEHSADEDLEALRQLVMEVYEADTFEEAARIAGESAGQIATVARLGGPICELAEQGNDAALAIIQQGTQELAEELIQMIDEADLRTDHLSIGINGSIIRCNPIFREQLAEALHYDFPQVSWQEAEIDPAFGAGLIAARLKGINVDIDSLKKNWRERHLRSAG
jgi:N-acetylglucosamine kinase-like BadF-type ATPase